MCKKLIIGTLIAILSSGFSLAADTPILDIDSGGHKAKIHDVKFTNDGRYLVSASEDKTVRVWDAGTGEIIRTFRGQIGSGYEGMIYAADLSPDGRVLAVGGFFPGSGESKFAIRLIDFRSGDITALLKKHSNAVLDITFSSDGRYLVSASADKTALIWDLKSGNTQNALRGHTDLIYAVSCSPDGKTVVTASDDGTLRLWDISSGNLISILKGHASKVRSVAFTPDGRYILSGSWDKTIRLWDGGNGRFIKVLASQETNIDSLSISKDSSLVVTGHGCCDPGAPSNVIEIPSGKKIASFSKHDNAVFATALSPDENIAATAGGDNFAIYLWDVRSGKTIRELVGQGAAVQGVGFSRDGQSIAWGKRDFRTLKVFRFPDLEQSFQLFEGNGFHLSMGRELAESRDYMRAIKSAGAISINTKDGNAHPVLQIQRGGRIIQEIVRDMTSGHDHHSITLTPDGRTVVSGGSGGVLSSYDPDTGKKLHDFIGHTGDILGVAPSPDGRYLVSGSDDQTVKLWEINSGRLLLTIFQGADREWVAWTPAGYYMSSLKGDNYIGWHMNRGENQSALYYPASRFAKQFYSPLFVEKYLESGGGNIDQAIQLVNAALPEQKPFQKVNVSDIQRIFPPAVFFQTPTDQHIVVNDNRIRIVAGAKSITDEPIIDIWLLVNGRRLDLDKELMDNARKKIDGQKAQIDITIPLLQKENRIAVAASNRYSQSEPEIIYVTSELQKSGDYSAEGEIENNVVEKDVYRPNLYLLAIGVSTYSNPDYNLESAHKDAIAVSDLFKKQKGTLYKEVHTRLLVNSQATQDSVLAGLDWLLKEATQKDTAIIFAAGHGLKDSRGNYYLLPHDGNPDKLRRTGVKWFDFEDVVTSLPSKVILMVDTCHSGSVTGKRRGVEDMTDALRELTNAGSGVVVITASTGKEESQERPEWDHGAFTKALVEGLAGKADSNKDRVIDIKELDFYITYRVKELTEGFQHPTTEIPKTLPNFPVAAWK